MHATADQLKLLKEAYEKHEYLPVTLFDSLATQTGLTRTYIKGWFQRQRTQKRKKAIKTESTEESVTTEPQPSSSTAPSGYAPSSDTIMAMKIETQEVMMQTSAQQGPARIDLESFTSTAPTAVQQAPTSTGTTTLQTPAQQGPVHIDYEMLLDVPDAVPAAVPNYGYDESRIAVPASFLPSLRSLFLDRVARAPLMHLARLENIPLQSSWHHPDCPLLITCSNDLTWYSFDPKHLPDTLRPQEAPLRYLDMLGRYIHHPYPPIDKMTLINLVLDDRLDPFKKAMGLLLLSRLGMKC